MIKRQNAGEYFPLPVRRIDRIPRAAFAATDIAHDARPLRQSGDDRSIDLIDSCAQRRKRSLLLRVGQSTAVPPGMLIRSLGHRRGLRQTCTVIRSIESVSSGDSERLFTARFRSPSLVAPAPMDTDPLLSGPLPILPMIFGGALLSVSVLLLTAGHRTLKVSFGLAGLVCGMAIGWLVTDALAPGFPAWIGAVLGGATLGAIFLLLFRLAIAVSLGIVCAIAAPLTLLTLGAVSSDPGDQPTIRLEYNDAPRTPAGEPAENDPGGADSLTRAAAHEAVRAAIDRELDRHPDAGERVNAFVAWADDRRDALGNAWERFDAPGQNRLRAAAAAGFILGVMLGFFLADLATILASAGAGAALAILGVRLLTEPLGLDMVGRALDRPAVAAGVWTLLALAGTALQWTRRVRRADNSRRSTTPR